ncbi:CACTA en-spm transposon protein [Cucumis melo var. makuwa]|uniref:CACTA en-spm transposon protein n=1 Tax=Cucumis melo var. makuwa TaxID=1194695 RepID=A0A5D3DHT4_CUCMM|nr:CACTA en-spm transposon protein [Cucumis melo var. makuwa]
MFLEFEDELDNFTKGSSSVDDNAVHGRISMMIAPGMEKPIFPHVVRFGQAISMCVRKTFLVRCLKWADVGREYIERFFVLDFNDQTMNRFVEHQMLNTFKTFQVDYHKHFKKYSNLEEARANPPNILHELVEKKGESIDRVKLFRETHVRVGTFVSQTTEDVHNQMLELQSQPTPEGSQPLSEDEICDQVLGRRPGYSKDLGWGPKPKARKITSASSSTISCSSSTQKQIELQSKINEALEQIEVQDRNHAVLAS